MIDSHHGAPSTTLAGSMPMHYQLLTCSTAVDVHGEFQCGYKAGAPY